MNWKSWELKTDTSCRLVISLFIALKGRKIQRQRQKEVGQKLVLNSEHKVDRFLI